MVPGGILIVVVHRWVGFGKGGVWQLQLAPVHTEKSRGEGVPRFADLRVV